MNKKTLIKSLMFPFLSQTHLSILYFYDKYFYLLNLFKSKNYKKKFLSLFKYLRKVNLNYVFQKQNNGIFKRYLSE